MFDDWDGVGYDSLSEIRTFYHASALLFLPGTVLEPGLRRNFSCSRGFVYLTDAPAPHDTVEHEARAENWFVYQVEPLGPVHLGACHDLLCGAARGVACLGQVSRFQGTSAVLLRPKPAPLGPSERAKVGH